MFILSPTAQAEEEEILVPSEPFACSCDRAGWEEAVGVTLHVRNEEGKTRGAKQCSLKAQVLSRLDCCVRLQSLSGREERYSCGPARACVVVEVCVEGLHLEESES